MQIVGTYLLLVIHFEYNILIFNIPTGISVLSES